MKKENKNVVVVSYPSCEEQPLAPESFYPGVGLPIKRAVVGQAPGVRVDNVRATRLRTCNPLATARGRFAVVGQAPGVRDPAGRLARAFRLLILCKYPPARTYNAVWL